MEHYVGLAQSLDDDDERKERLLKQFHETGMDDSETWSLDTSIIKYLHSRLVKYYEIADEKIDLDYHEGLRQDIEKMIEGFSYGVDDSYFNLKDKEDKMKKVNEAFEILAKRHGYLWW